jgi:predicted  nucleic acid-binding Zn-ribbon protein
MDPDVAMGLLIPLAGVAIICVTVVKLARLRANKGNQPLSADAAARFEALEQDVRALHQELSETQERLDFTERLLTKAREEKRVGG